MRAFVTGGTGFIGSHLVAALRRRGDEVTALVRTPSKAAPLKELGVTLVDGDVTEPSTLSGPIARADTVFHLAAWYEFGVTDRTRMYQINVRGTENVMRAAADTGVARVLYCSSIAVFGMRAPDDVADESTRHAGTFTTLYEETKFQAHQKVLEHSAGGLPVVFALPGGVYGPGDQSLLGFLLRMYAKGWLVALPAVTLQTQFSFVHVEDLVDGMIAAAEKGRSGESYILGGENGRVAELFERLEPITGIRRPRAAVPNFLLRAALPFSGLAGRLMKQGPRVIHDGLASMGGSWMASSAKASAELGYVYRAVADAMPNLVASLKER